MGALSTTRPAYMTTMRSAIPATTPRSWLMSTMDVPNCARISRSKARICACTVTSRALVGSSAITSRGSHIRLVHSLEHIERAALGLAPRGRGVMHPHFGELHADPYMGSERGHRILKDHRELRAADPIERRSGEAEQLGAVETHAPCDARVAREKSEG